MATFKKGQKVTYNQGRGFNLIGKIIRVDKEAEQVILQPIAESSYAFEVTRSFEKVSTL